MLKLTITCDDCGLSEGINRAALDLYHKNMTTTVSVMMNFPSTQHAFDLFRQHDDLDIGLHLNLTEGEAITEFRSSNALVNAKGSFRSREIFAAQALIGRTSFLSLAEQEMEAQVNAFLDAGQPPRHLTTHMHFHVIPALRNIVYRLAQQYHIAWVRNGYLRSAAESYNPFFRRSNTIDDAPSPTPNFVVSVGGWQRWRRPEHLLKRLCSLRGHIELVVHPDYEYDDTFPSYVSYGVSVRYREWQYYHRLFDLMQATMPDTFVITPFMPDAVVPQ